MVSERIRRLGRYSLVERIASGPSNDIYLAAIEESFAAATDSSGRAVPPGTLCVVKVSKQRSPAHLAMLEREAMQAMRFRHRSAVSILEIGRADGESFVAMEYVRGRSLADILGRSIEYRRPLPRELVLWIGAELAAVLNAAHKTPWTTETNEGIIHGELSPPSVMIGWDGNVRLTGLGIGRSRFLLSPSLSRLPYRAPEAIETEKTNELSDIYSLGVLIYDALCGDRVFRRATIAETKAAVLRGKFDRLETRLDYVSEIVAELLWQMMSRWPASRPQSAEYVERALRSQVRASDETIAQRLGDQLRKDFSAEMEAERRLLDSAQTRLGREPTRVPSIVVADDIDAGLSAAFDDPPDADLADVQLLDDGGDLDRDTLQIVTRPRPPPAEVDSAGDFGGKTEPMMKMQPRAPDPTVEDEDLVHPVSEADDTLDKTPPAQLAFMPVERSQAKDPFEDTTPLHPAMQMPLPRRPSVVPSDSAALPGMLPGPELPPLMNSAADPTPPAISAQDVTDPVLGSLSSLDSVRTAPNIPAAPSLISGPPTAPVHVVPRAASNVAPPRGPSNIGAPRTPSGAVPVAPSVVGTPVAGVHAGGVPASGVPAAGVPAAGVQRSASSSQQQRVAPPRSASSSGFSSGASASGSSPPAVSASGPVPVAPMTSAPSAGGAGGPFRDAREAEETTAPLSRAPSSARRLPPTAKTPLQTPMIPPARSDSASGPRPPARSASGSASRGSDGDFLSAADLLADLLDGIESTDQVRARSPSVAPAAKPRPKSAAGNQPDRRLGPASSGAAGIAGSMSSRPALAQIARYELSAEVGRTGAARLYEGRAPSGEAVTLKVLDPTRIDDPRLRAEEWTACFGREVSIARKLSSSGLPRLLEAGQEGSLQYIVYDRVEGVPLNIVIGRGKLLDPESLRKIIVSLALSLAHMHERGFVYCNVQAQNVLMTRDGLARLNDLSMASPIAGPMHPLLGTNTFALSPEWLWGQAYQPASDQFALGALLYELLTNTRPFRGLDDRMILAAIKEKDPLPPHTIDSRVNTFLSEVAMRALNKQPDRRFSSCEVFAQHLAAR